MLLINGEISNVVCPQSESFPLNNDAAPAQGHLVLSLSFPPDKTKDKSAKDGDRQLLETSDVSEDIKHIKCCDHVCGVKIEESVGDRKKLLAEIKSRDLIIEANNAEMAELKALLTQLEATVGKPLAAPKNKASTPGRINDSNKANTFKKQTLPPKTNRIPNNKEKLESREQNMYYVKSTSTRTTAADGNTRSKSPKKKDTKTDNKPPNKKFWVY